MEKKDLAYSGKEQRKYGRVDCRFLTSFLMSGAGDKVEITQSKNMSLGGILLTTSKPIKKAAIVNLEIRLPGASSPVLVSGKVIESTRNVNSLFYNTRFEFSSPSENDKEIIFKALDNRLKRLKSNS